MPEGHSLHRLARSLTRTFGGQLVEASSPQGRFTSGADAIDGRVLERAEAWGKHLVVGFEGELFVHVHLGLYGTWVRKRAPAPEPWGAVRLRLVGESWYADLRGPTTCELIDPHGRDLVVARLGPDPLRRDGDPVKFRDRVLRSRAPIGALLMDQSVLAGVGNIYRAEVLFLHGVSPFAEGRSLPPSTVDAMWAELATLMRDGVRRGRIVTVAPDDVGALAALDTDRPSSDDPRLDGGEDTSSRRRVRRSTGVYVYRRDGRECLRCGSAISAADFRGRRLYWCPGCQRERRCDQPAETSAGRLPTSSSPSY